MGAAHCLQKTLLPPWKEDRPSSHCSYKGTGWTVTMAPVPHATEASLKSKWRDTAEVWRE